MMTMVRRPMMIMIRLRCDDDIDYLMKVMMNLMIMIMTQVTEKAMMIMLEGTGR